MNPLRHDLRGPRTRPPAAARGATVRPIGGAPPPDGRALSVVVPMRDEEDNVLALVAEIRNALAAIIDYEIVLVDDGSRDDTARAMRRAREHCGARVRVLRHDRNRGQSVAICTGVRAARGSLVATLDGDGQNDPADILRLVEELLMRAADGVTMVAGERRVRRDSLVRRLSSRVANGVRSTLLRDGVADTGCGLKVFARDTFLELPPFDHMHRFLPALVRAAGGAVHTVPVAHRPRRAGRSKYGVGNRLWVGIVDLFGVMWLTRRQVALRTGWEEPE